ncbi:nuclear transport factor 2 family protein [Novosphingobium huizhouense]|uniref:nuclear transport factor 2 family protein n=1 Tax=Novosphingobium huizhouense TaxID=2866625 RepID=UPI001CD8FA88|nr:nuclear transport factor 2 family protein [Novosphingobium huizhouense]
MTKQPIAEPDYDRLLRVNLQDVFNQRNARLRAEAVARLYIDNPLMFEPGTIVEGRAAIANVAGQLLDRFGPDFAFVPDGAALGHHGMATLRWHAGTPENPAMVHGFDTAEIVDGRIARLWVLLGMPDG